MKWSLLFFAVFFAVSQFLHAQHVRFSKFYDHDQGLGGFLNIIDYGGGLIAQGTNFKNGVRQSYTVQVDSEGSLLNEHAVFDVNVGYESFGMIRLDNGQIVSSGSLCDYNGQSPSPCDYYFARLDATGDTLFTKVYERRDTCDLLLNMVQTRPNKIMLIGWTCNDTTQNNPDLLFITVDTLGNELNRVVWGGAGTDYVHSGLVINEDGDVLMTGYTLSFGAGNGKTWVLETDSIGNVQWHEIYLGLSSQGDGGIGISKLLSDGNYIVVGAINYQNGSDAYMLKIEPDGTEIWRKRFQIPRYQGLYKAEELPDGSILACGQTTNTDDNSQAGWLVKTDANGDTLWTRTYNPSPLIDRLLNMLVLPNGDIVMVGSGRTPGQTNQDGWILRVDSMGCLIEGCWSVGLEEQLSVDHGQLSIWPNPSEYFLNISAPAPLEALRLCDMQGRTIMWIAAQGRERLEIDVSMLNTGLYILELIDREGIRSVSKLIVHRP